MESTLHSNHRRRKMLSAGALAGSFLAAHGAMHAVLLNTPRPDGGAGNFLTRAGESALLGPLGIGGPGVEALGTVLALVAAAGFVLSALAYLGLVKVPRWRSVLLGSAALSLLTTVLFWNDWMVAAPVIDVAIVAALLRNAPTAAEA